MTTLPDRLLACPFCGGEAKLSTFLNVVPRASVGCTNNDCIAYPYIEADTADEAIAAWNTRTAAAALSGCEAVACQKCKGRRYVVDGDIDDYGTSIGTLENCPACNGVVCASTLDDAAGDPVLTVETARSLLRDAAAGIRYLYATPQPGDGVVVPREPTEAMLEACLAEMPSEWGNGEQVGFDDARGVYRAAIAAAPSAKGVGDAS